MKLFSAAESYDPSADTSLKQRAAAVGIELPAKRRDEKGEMKADASGAVFFFPEGGGQARPVMGADGKQFVDTSERLVVKDGLPVTPGEALNYRAHKSENEARRGERTEDRQTEATRRAHEDRVKALEAEVDRERLLEADADKAEAETNETLEKLRAAVAARDLAAKNLDRLRKLRDDEGDDGAKAADISAAEGELEKARIAVNTLHTRMGKLSDRNKQQYPGLFEQDGENWTARRVKGRLTESGIRLQGERWGKSEAEITATIEDARKRGMLR